MEVTKSSNTFELVIAKRMVFTLVFGKADADLRYVCSVQRRGVGWTTAVDIFLLVYDVKSEERAFLLEECWIKKFD